MDAKGTVRARLPATAGSLPLSYASRERRERKYPVLKSSFAYCASRRRVFGPANNGGLPLSTSVSLSLCALSSASFSHTCAGSRACLQDHYCRRATSISRSARARGIQRSPLTVDHPRSRTSPDHPGRSLGHSRDFHSSRPLARHTALMRIYAAHVCLRTKERGSGEEGRGVRIFSHPR